VTSDWRSFLERNQDRYLADLVELLRIPSVSSMPAHVGDVERAARWTADRLTAAGMEHAVVLPTEMHPVVYADWLHAPGQPTVLLYGHVDVLPGEPLEEWTTPPFEPSVREGVLYARGAADMKAGTMALIAAVEAMLRTSGKLPVNVKFFVEAEEEIGSPSVPGLLRVEKERFACDMLLSADGGQRAPDQPVLVLGCRGNVALQIDVRGTSADLHSGGYGGMAPNAANALVDLIASMRAPDGRVLVEGFYDGVRPLTEEMKAEIAAVAEDEETVRARIDALTLVGEPGFTPSERNVARPSFDLNGIWGGFQGEGSKNVIPAQAHAKINCRLVPDQDPEHVIACITRHVESHTPPGVSVSVSTRKGRSRPFSVPRSHPGMRVAESVLADLYGRAPVAIRMGGSLPFVAPVQELLGADTINMGLCTGGQGAHAPNEFQPLENILRGQIAYALFLERLAAQPG
jgi:acetylornithine deacetylase/succinyl-diaminopimelate desuccinylase-like protein